MPLTPVVISVRIGGTNGCADLYELEGAITPLYSVEFKVSKHTKEIPGDFEADYEQLVSAIERLVDWWGDLPEGIALVVAGDPDTASQMIEYSGNLGHWIGQPVVARLAERYAVRVVLLNDAAGSALAEAAFGICSREFAGVDFILGVYGTGIGGATARIVEAGTPGAFYLNDFWVLAENKEIGHFRVSNDPAFTCNGHEEPGHIEAYAGGGNFDRNYGALGEEMTRDELRQPLQWLIKGLMLVLDKHPVGLLVFMGGVIYHQPWMLQEIEDALQAAGYDVQVRLSYFGKSADTLGGLAALRQ